MIDQNKIVRLSYTKFDKLTRVIEKGVATNIYRTNNGERLKVLEVRSEEKVVLLYPEEKSE